MKRLLVRLSVAVLMIAIGAIGLVQLSRGPREAQANPPSTGAAASATASAQAEEFPDSGQMMSAYHDRRYGTSANVPAAAAPATATSDTRYTNHDRYAQQVRYTDTTSGGESSQDSAAAQPGTAASGPSFGSAPPAVGLPSESPPTSGPTTGNPAMSEPRRFDDGMFSAAPAMTPPAAPAASAYSPTAYDPATANNPLASDTMPPTESYPREAASPLGGLPPGGLPSTDNAAALPGAAAAPGTAAAHTIGTGRPGNHELEGRQSPSLEIEKLTPAEIQVGSPAVFEIRVRNVGNAPAQDVVVYDEVPQGTQVLSTEPRATRGGRGELTWSLGTIAPGAESIVRLELMPTTEGEIGSVARVQFAALASSRTISTRPQLAVEVTTVPEVLIGQELPLKIRVSNTGTGLARNVVISEHVPNVAEHPSGGELEYQVGDLAPGESREIELVLAAVKAGEASNLLVARGEGQLQAERRTPVRVTAPGLEVVIDGPRRRFLDRPATYNVLINNPGTAAAEQVELITYLPPGMEFIDANNAGVYDSQAHAVHWLLEELPARKQGSVTLNARPVETGQQTLRAVSTARGGLTAEAREAVSVEGVAALLFQVADLSDPIEVGEETVYEIHIVNQGSKEATNIELTVLVPNELRASEAEGPTRYDISGQTIRFDPLPRLAARGETTYRVKARGAMPGDSRLRVQLKSDEISTPITKEESTRVYSDE